MRMHCFNKTTFPEKAHAEPNRKYYLIEGRFFLIKKRVGERLEWQRDSVRINLLFSFRLVNLLEV